MKNSKNRQPITIPLKRLIACLLFVLYSAAYATGSTYSDSSIGRAQYRLIGDTHSLYNNVLQVDFSTHNGRLSARRISNKIDSSQTNLSELSLFTLELSDGTLYSSRDFTLVGPVNVIHLQSADTLPTPALRYPGLQLHAKLNHKSLPNLQINWIAELRDGSNYLRQQIILTPATTGLSIAKIILLDGCLKGAEYAGTVLGCPVICRNYFFGMEHPIAHSPAMTTRLVGNLGEATYDVTPFIKSKGTYGFSIEHGGGSDDYNVTGLTLRCGTTEISSDHHPLNGANGSNQYCLTVDRYQKGSSYSLSISYRNAEKATGLIHLYQKKPHRLSFYVERKDTLKAHQTISESSVMGVSAPHRMRRAFQNYIDRERARPYKPFLHYNCWWDITDDGASSFTSEQLIERMHAWYQKFIKPYNIHLNAFVFDDGWDDMHHHVWAFDPQKFPNGFAEQARLCKAYHSGIGVWMSPFGGYLEAQQQRIKIGKQEGLETNARGLSLAGPRYYERFLSRSIDMLSNYQVNYFKYDGFGGSEPAYLPDMEAGIRLVKRLRQINPDVYINMTVGSWPSPFWLRYVDCTWRGSGDLHQAGEGERTQKFMTYRDGTLYNNIVRRSPYYPLNSIMTAGIAYANLGHPSRYVSDDLQGFKDMVRSSLAAGSSLKELYISHDKMKPEQWAILAEAVKWSTRHASILEDTHWIGGSPINLDLYGFASWKNGEGILCLRNPADKAQQITIDLCRWLELSNTEAGRYLLKTPWAEAADQRSLTVATDRPTVLTLKPFECLVFNVTRCSK